MISFTFPTLKTAKRLVGAIFSVDLSKCKDLETSVCVISGGSNNLTLRFYMSSTNDTPAAGTEEKHKYTVTN